MGERITRHPPTGDPDQYGDVPDGAIAWKYADPTEPARWVMSDQDYQEIRGQDPALLVDVLTCGDESCGHRWAYGTPASRCPKEYDHPDHGEEEHEDACMICGAPMELGVILDAKIAAHMDASLSDDPLVALVEVSKATALREIAAMLIE